MVRTRFASLALASSMLFSSGCFCWGSGTCFPRLRAAFCGTNTCCSGSGSMGGAPVMSGYDGMSSYAPGAMMSMPGGGPDCNCQNGSASFHPAIMAPSMPSSPTIVPSPAPAASGPVVPTEGAIFPGSNAPIMMQQPTVAPPTITPTPGMQPNRLSPMPATPSPYRPQF
jgi:hypothetical protein